MPGRGDGSATCGRHWSRSGARYSSLPLNKNWLPVRTTLLVMLLLSWDMPTAVCSRTTTKHVSPGCECAARRRPSRRTFGLDESRTGPRVACLPGDPNLSSGIQKFSRFAISELLWPHPGPRVASAILKCGPSLHRAQAEGIRSSPCSINPAFRGRWQCQARTVVQLRTPAVDEPGLHN
jgi:hypothetical protein